MSSGLGAGPPTMSHIDSTNQEVCVQLLHLHYGVSTLLGRLPLYIRSTRTLHKPFLAATVDHK